VKKTLPILRFIPFSFVFLFNFAFAGALPSAPYSLTATSGNKSVSLSWSSSEVYTYNVYRSTISGAGYALIKAGL